MYDDIVPLPWGASDPLDHNVIVTNLGRPHIVTEVDGTLQREGWRKGRRRRGRRRGGRRRGRNRGMGRGDGTEKAQGREGEESEI